MLPWQGGVTAPTSSQPQSQPCEAPPARGPPSCPRVMRLKVMQVQGRGASVESFGGGGEGEKNIWIFKSLGFVSEMQGREKASCGQGKGKRKGKDYYLQEWEAVCKT